MFDHPEPTASLRLIADERHYDLWGEEMVDEFPVPQNLAEVTQQIIIPSSIEELHRMNCSGEYREHESNHWNNFQASISYSLRIDPSGQVNNIKLTTTSYHLDHVTDSFIDALNRLSFKPAVKLGVPVNSKAIAVISIQFTESETSSPSKDIFAWLRNLFRR
ncbi:MAG: hypothetical protein R3C11_29800 [Planctomycetaceae bacterium]